MKTVLLRRFLAAHHTCFLVAALSLATLFASSSFGQQISPAATTQIADLQAELTAAENLLHNMEAQQKSLLAQVEQLQRQLTAASASAPPASHPSEGATKTPAAPEPPEEHFKDGMVIRETSPDAKVPFLLKFNINTQVRYLNTTSSDETFTDHLGGVREVHTRNDITVNRTMFILGGYVFDPRLRYSFTAWTSAGAASIVLAGNIGWRFSKALTLTGGYTGVPGSRSLVNTFPFWTGADRSMADNFFRPGFTQGAWATGDLGRGLSYLAFVGNGLNTLSITANKIDTNLMYSGSLWWEPWGDYSGPGKSRWMYDDYFDSKDVRIRLGTAFTHSREDRFSNTDQSSPDNTALYNSDGVLTFSTGAFAPGVTVNNATYKMWATDAGVKWNGWAFNGQYYFRWLDNFAADGPLPLTSTFDNGFEVSLGKFIIPKKLMLYARGGMVYGEFNTPSEYGGGFKWYVLPTERFWVAGELMRVNHSPYSGAFTPYTSGLNGWVPMIQSILAF